MRVLLFMIGFLLMSSCREWKPEDYSVIEVVDGDRVEFSSMQNKLSMSSTLVLGPYTYSSESLYRINNVIHEGEKDVELSTVWQDGESRLLFISINNGKWFFSYNNMQQRLLEDHSYLIKITGNNFQYIEMLQTEL